MSILEQAVKIAMTNGPGSPGKTEDHVRDTFSLCQKNKGLMVGADFVAAWFRYNPDLGKLVAKMDIPALIYFDLTKGELMHIAYVTAPKGVGLRLIRNIIKHENPWGVTAFYQTRDGEMFHSKVNPSWREA